MKRKKAFEEFAGLIWRKLWEEKGIEFLYLKGRGKSNSSLYFFSSIVSLTCIHFGLNPEGGFSRLFYNNTLNRFFFQMARAEGERAYTLKLTENHLGKVPEGILFYLIVAAKKRKDIFVMKHDIKTILEFDLKKYCDDINLKSKYPYMFSKRKK